MTFIPVRDVTTPRARVAPGEAPLTANRCEDVANVLKGLADPIRLLLFSHIAAHPNPVCVCDIPDAGVSQPTVSHHLRKLRDTGLVDCERRGTWVYYWATPLGATCVPFLSRLAGDL
ncbi:helix-turn-helix transcriptional regulator [Allobranchiibius sp. GilTou73]|uniref:ArsR/SmtB family transcription factor n=1 Tax=Allobranchiibius sp. GilTou73 TaxID=2904523 RepID=UPI001F39ADB1|nr:metalloregulator ArsR/SmtB family transcription factor [Allobranchiibius sp. GilTou73]UIJ35152.1 metalloregulator ArsR/SmtB family transcription factor [Allobranchiibius sp. GilTou73]